MIFKGCATALVTPFREDGKSVNYDSFKKLIDFQLENGVSALLFLGTTGEPPTLSESEKEEIVKFAVGYVNRRCPVIVGSGGNCTEKVVETSKLYENLGVDALLVVTPYYNKCTQNGLIEHYKSVANSTKLPIIMYNVPARTGLNMLPQTVNELSKIKNIVGIKEASGNIEQLMENVKLSYCEEFSVYTGDDSLILPAMCVGASGVISVTSNVVPKEVSKLCDLCFKNELNSARSLAYRISKLVKLLFCEVNPIPVKTAVSLIGINCGAVRLPLTNLTNENKVKLEEELKNLNIV